MTRLQLKTEIAIVLALSLGASALYSVVSLIAKATAPNGLAAQTTSLNGSMARAEWLDLTYQLLGIFLGLAPVALVLYLIWRDGLNPFKKLGLNFGKPKLWALGGLGLAAVIGIPGIGLYVLARLLELSSKVVPANLPDYWWAVPVLLLAAVRAALFEEVIVVGYLFKRMDDLRVQPLKQILLSALLRGSYHLYQGIGGFVGNLIMGLVFGWAYRRWGRIMPLVVAHFILDAVSFVGFALVGKSLQLP